jgi:acetoin utilization deacetylase AcuC-like enzyme
MGEEELPAVKKIAIVDTDCHHGDGTQDIYWHDPDVLYISIHQDGRTLYPAPAFPRSTASERGGVHRQHPLPPMTSDEGILGRPSTWCCPC